jgi:hypothetical protein
MKFGNRKRCELAKPASVPARDANAATGRFSGLQRGGERATLRNFHLIGGMQT